MQNLEEIIHLQENPSNNDSSNNAVQFLPDTQKEKKDTRIDEAIVELAINETGFGKFSIKVTVICFLIYLNISLCTVSTGFILPAAACDLKMNTVDKGLLSTSFFIGSCFSSVISGFLANLKGRKWTLTIFLFLQGISDLLQAIVPNYSTIMGLKFFSGFAATGQLITIFTYMSECLPLKQRKSLLSLMEFFWISGHGVASGFGIIPLEFEIKNENFSFRSWNLYILICSLPGIFLGFWIIAFPETPKYLAEMGYREELLKVLVKMYEENLGKSGKEYIEILMSSENSLLIKVANQSHEKLADLKKNSINEKILFELKQMGTVLKKPHIKNTFLACVTAFCVPAAYFALYLWLPEIFQRFAEFEAKNKNEKPNFCKVSREIYSSLSTTDHLEDPFGCDRTIDTDVFINNLLLCASCVPAIFPVLCLVHRFGFKILLASMCLICSAVVFGIYFVNSSLQNLILLCIYLPLISVCITITFALFVSIFPTNLRSSGVTLTSFSSRIGAAFGNIIFSYLIDEYCFQFIVLVTLLLVVSAVTTMLIHER
ncbi:synaptic vesicle glycoprotein 2B-like isoform X2 [Leptopilina boulardi]|uniref:synaptic vesicle glycoprotein 2B-like isoform X2 n=1 Tax=Leptopilina boulardi TaxID=63433 RepID=UPI0021F57693|nr:synaptic vesicle glycoprotein 2B-like isoform X2 [Leptopilina boulardi]